MSWVLGLVSSVLGKKDEGTERLRDKECHLDSPFPKGKRDILTGIEKCKKYYLEIILINTVIAWAVTNNF